jgi:hypothetical protein
MIETGVRIYVIYTDEHLIALRISCAQESLAADRAIASFSSRFILSQLNTDRAPQLKAGVRRFRRFEKT